MNFDSKFDRTEKREKEPEIKIIRGSEAPAENKNNPFYNSYFWAMADWENKNLYLPDKSDEAISFSVAAHELGHLINAGRIQPTRFDFAPTYKEELRAWDKGWSYLEKYLPEYYNGDQNVVDKLQKVKDEIEKRLMKITELTEPFYQKTENSKQEQRDNFLKTDLGQEIKTAIDNLKIDVENIISEMGLDEFLQTIDFDRYKMIVNKALLNIERDNSEIVE